MLGAAGGAHANLSVGYSPMGLQSLPGQFQDSAGPRAQSLEGDDPAVGWPEIDPQTQALPLTLVDFEQNDQKPADGGVKELPPSPASASLFLSAMGTLGALQLGRVVRKAHWGHLPDWYHAGAPAQIGHAFVADLDLTALPPCRFDQPAGERPFESNVRCEQPPRWNSQSFLPLAAPRGPPSFS